MATRQITNIENQENIMRRLVIMRLIPHGVCAQAYQGFLPNEYLLVGKDGNYGYAAPDKQALVSCLFHKVEMDDEGNYIFSCKWTDGSVTQIFDNNFKMVSVKYT